MHPANKFELKNNHHILYICGGALLVLMATLFVVNFLHLFSVNTANAETHKDEDSAVASVNLKDNLTVGSSSDAVVLCTDADRTANSGECGNATIPDPAGSWLYGATTVDVSTNNATGYSLYVSVSENSDTTALVNSEKNTEIPTLTAASTYSAMNAATVGSALMNKYGFTTNNNGSDATIGQIAEGAYLPMPAYPTAANEDSWTLIKATDTNAEESTTAVTFGMKADQSLATGTYTNTVTFTAVANPAAPTCPAYTICYDSNGADGGVMDNQTTTDEVTTTDGTGFANTITAANASSVTLRAQNFWRSGYGFAGWNTKADGSGTQYGPMESIDMSSYSASGLTLYAKWVASTGDLQSYTCSDLSTGQVTARKDTRDNNVYTVGKLADGKCWMVENLRLGGASSMSLTTAASVTAGTLQASSNSFNTSSYTVQQMNAQNTITSGFSGLTASPGGKDTGRDGANYYWYGYGNYYSWPQAIMSTSSYTTSYQKTTSSLCPKGWRLPSGMESSSNNGDFGKLSAAMGYNQTTMNASSTPTGAVASAAFRKYPYNFLYSGYWYGAQASSRGSNGYYWSSTVNDSNYAYDLYLHSTYLYPGTSYYYKYYGYSVRCVTGS